MGKSFEPISLGCDCSQKFQVCRILFSRAYPNTPVDRLREAIADGRARSIFRRLPFDFQITPIQALIEYLESDFRGVFEREDLTVSEHGFVLHKRLLTQHPHQFHAVDGRFDKAVIDAQYPVARAKFEKFAANFRAMQQERGPFLYVRSETPWPEQIEQLIAALAGPNPNHEFHILTTRDSLRDDLAPFAEKLTQAVVGPSGKTGDRHWEGNHEDWDRAFAGFDLSLPEGRGFTANLNPIRTDREDEQSLVLQWGLPPDAMSPPCLPCTFDIPSQPYAFAALSSRVEGLAGRDPKHLLVRVEVLAGRAGVGLVTEDGTAMIGREYVVSPDDGPITLPLPLEPAGEPARVVLRNYGSETAGAIRLNGVSLVDRGPG